jgi:hypothetical protein
MSNHDLQSQIEQKNGTLLHLQQISSKASPGGCNAIIDPLFTAPVACNAKVAFLGAL